MALIHGVGFSSDEDDNFYGEGHFEFVKKLNDAMILELKSKELPNDSELNIVVNSKMNCDKRKI